MKKISCKHLLIFAIVMVIMMPVLVCASPVPDTGQTNCYDNTQEIPCPQPGEPFYGQDAQYSINPHSYTDFGNGIVRDNVTGLEWQQATAPGTYTWDEANTYCENLTLGEHGDWRLSTIKELSTLVDISIPWPGPTINTSFFPDTVASYYWSSTTNVYYTGYAWGVTFGYGNVYYYYDKTSPNYVRAVRGGQSSNSFVDNSDGTISDTSTGLMWQKYNAPEGFNYTWQHALTYCENLTLAGHNDWRLPNRNELQTIVDYSTMNPSIDTTYFPSAGVSYYWSSTAYVNYTDYAWLVDFNSGYVNYSYKTYGNYVRAVRGGQSVPTVINLSSFTATPKAGKVIIQWSTEAETDNAGFNIYRATKEDGEYDKINGALIAAEGSSTEGASYEFIDSGLKNGKTYYYKLEDIDLSGESTIHGPVKAVPRWIYGIRK